MGNFYFYDATGNQGLWYPSRPPAYGLQGGRVRNVISAETIGGRVRSESRGDDRLTLTMEWKYLSLAELRVLESIHATYGGNAAPFRIQVPDGVFPGVYGNAVVPVRWPGTDFSPVAVSYGLYGVRMALVENLSTSTVLSGTVTQANSHLSLISGTAFTDLTGISLSTYANGSYYLILTDSAGRRLAGWLKAAGGGETVDAEILTNPGFSPDSGWTKEAGWTIAGGVAVATGGISTVIYQSVTLTIGRLYKTSFDLVSRTAGDVGIFLTEAILPKQNAPATYARYRTATEIAPNFCIQGSGYSGTCDNASLKHVLTPSATGATIVSTRGGTTYNWAYEDTGFNRNDASGYKYAVYSY